MADRGSCEGCAGRDPDKGMQDVPPSVDARRLVCKKLNAVHETCSRHYQRMGEDFKVAG